MRRGVLHAALVVLLATSAAAEVIDRIAAIVDDQVITTSEIEQLAEIRFIPRLDNEPDDDYRTRILDDLIDQTLRYRDVQRFGNEPVSDAAVDARIEQIASRFPSRDEFDAALRRTGLTLRDLRLRVERRLEVERHVDEQFSPLVFVSLDEIERYYQDVWLPERLAKNLPRVPLASVRDQLRATLKTERLRQEVDRWTAQLRGRANVDVYGAH